MREERTVTLEGQVYTVVISDEQEALLAAAAAGRAIIGLWDRKKQEPELTPAVYVVEHPEDIDQEYLELVVRRKLGIPWNIGETQRLLIREFTMEDIDQVIPEEDDLEADRIFYTPDQLKEYIKNQYEFYQYGIWALIEKSSGKIVGKAGVTNIDMESIANHEVMKHEEVPDLELGYHIFSPYRKQGYAREACMEIQRYMKCRLDAALYVKIDPSNEASIQLAEDCGFSFIEQRYSEAVLYYSLYGWNC